MSSVSTLLPAHHASRDSFIDVLVKNGFEFLKVSEYLIICEHFSVNIVIDIEAEGTNFTGLLLMLDH